MFFEEVNQQFDLHVQNRKKKKWSKKKATSGESPAWLFPVFECPVREVDANL